jgi:hypothetical protein
LLRGGVNRYVSNARSGVVVTFEILLLQFYLSVVPLDQIFSGMGMQVWDANDNGL